MLAVHADWSVDPRKRWMTLARPNGSRWAVAAPVPVGALGTLLDRLSAQADGGPVALGVDLPLGLPRAFAEQQAANSFPEFLRGLVPGSTFFEVCATLDQLGPTRPFYPARGTAGLTRASHAAALGFAHFSALSRMCDRATDQRPAGASLFWTLGANQTGKAAIAAWRDLLLPALVEGRDLALWPFDGDLLPLLAPGRIVVAETYPAEAARQLGIRVLGSKARLADRAAAAPMGRAAMAALGAVPDPALVAAIEAGFALREGADDGFDSVIGVLCVIAVLQGRRPDGVPPPLASDRWVRQWEGWVLGQTALPRAAPIAVVDGASVRIL